MRPMLPIERSGPRVRRSSVWRPKGGRASSDLAARAVAMVAAPPTAMRRRGWEAPPSWGAPTVQPPGGGCARGRRALGGAEAVREYSAERLKRADEPHRRAAGSVRSRPRGCGPGPLVARHRLLRRAVGHVGPAVRYGRPLLLGAVSRGSVPPLELARSDPLPLLAVLPSAARADSAAAVAGFHGGMGHDPYGGHGVHDRSPVDPPRPR